MRIKKVDTMFKVYLAATILFAYSCVNAAPNVHKSMQEKIMVVAHRACWSTAPENSIAALEHCQSLGVDAVEIDVRLTRDGQVVVFHDKTIDRMTEGSGELSEITYQELQKLHLKERDSTGADIMGGRPFLTQHKIPLLEEMLQVAGDDMLINLETKASDRWSFEETFSAAIKVVQAAGIDQQVFWKIPPPKRGGGVSDVPADAFYRKLPTDNLAMLSPIIWRSERPFTEQLEDFSDDSVAVFELVSDDLNYWPKTEDKTIFGSDRFIYMGVSILPEWGGEMNDERALMDPDAAWGKMIDLGFKLIMTDRPEQLVNYLKKRGLR